MIQKGFKYRIYPTKEQSVLMAKHFGCVRWVYNWGLDQKTKAYQETGKSPSRFELDRQLTSQKKNIDTVWLSDVSSSSLQNSLERLDGAYTKFFKEKKGFPKFKSKHRGDQSFSSPQANRLIEENKLSIPKFREGIKIKLHRKFEGTIKSVTISRNPSGKYFASLTVETTAKIIKPKKPSKKKSIGVDLGIKTFAVLSTGEEIQNPKHLKKSLKRLRRAHRNVSRKVKGSNNRMKAKKILALQYEKVTNQRTDFLHKVSLRLIRENQTVCLETLNVKGMMQNHKLAQALSDISIGTFNRFMEYKGLWYGTNILRCGRFEASSKICNKCGATNHALTLADRTWTCLNCNSTHDRDINAAKNIRDFCFHKNSTVRQGLPEFTLAENGVTRSVKQEIIYNKP